MLALYPILLALITSEVFCKKGVPVLLWAPNRAPTTHPVVSALQQVPYPTFQADFVNSFNSDKVLLFLQDELSVEDLTNHGEQLKSLSKWIEKSQSVYLPSVENPSFMMHDLPTHGYEVQTLEPGSEQGGITVKNQTKSLIVVKLPPTATNPSRKNSLQKADEVISSVLSKIGGLADFVVVFTAQRSSTIMHDFPVRRSRVKREANFPGFHFSPCVLFYIKEKFFLNKTENRRTESFVIPDGNYNNVGDCGKSNNVMLKILYSDIQGFQKLHIALNFVKDRRRWKLMGANIYDMNYSSQDILLYPTRKMESVPIGKSYTCGANVILKSDSSSQVQYTLLIPGMQVEAFTNNRTKFSQSWDCVGFLTAPIWAGWITASVLGSVLFLGLGMILGLKTSDRFDDPKTAHVMVTTTVD